MLPRYTRVRARLTTVAAGIAVAVITQWGYRRCSRPPTAVVIGRAPNTPALVLRYSPRAIRARGIA